MSNVIRQITIGPDYLNGMVYKLGQKKRREFDGENRVYEIVQIRKTDHRVYEIWIKAQNGGSYLYKTIEYMPVALEYNINY